MDERAQHQEGPDLRAEPALAIPFTAPKLQPLLGNGQLLYRAEDRTNCMEKGGMYELLKELHQHLLSRRDAAGIAILQKALALVQTRTLSDVSEGELMDFLHTIEETEGTGADRWVSSSAVRTEVGLVTRGMIEKEINRRVIET